MMASVKARLRRWLAAPHRKAGDAARDRNDWSAAAVHYQQYLRHRPDHVAVRIRRANALKETGDIQLAYGELTLAKLAAPAEPMVYRALGDLEDRRGDTPAAVAAWLMAWRLGDEGHSGWAMSRPERRASLSQILTTENVELHGAIDGLYDLGLEGWAHNPADPCNPVGVELLADGEVIATAMAQVSRPDIARHGLAPEHCGFRFKLGALLDRETLPSLTVRLSGSKDMLAGSPFALFPAEGVQRWLIRDRAIPGRADGNFPLLSIVMPVHNVRPEWLGEAISSVRAQADGRWELICVDDGSTRDDLIDILDNAARADKRISIVRHQVSLGIAGATNSGLEVAKAGYVLFMDHDDRLEPEAVGRFIQAMERDPDLIYSDEALTGENTGDLRTLIARPAFSWHYYLGHPYFVHPLCVKRDLALQIGGLDPTVEISADIDFTLRALEVAGRVGHLPGILYRWRTHAGSAGHRAASAASIATRGALKRHLHRLGLHAEVEDGPVSNTFRIDFADPGGRVLVVIPTKDRADLLRVCIESIDRTTAPGDVDIVIVDHESRDPDTRAYLTSLGERAQILTYSGPFNFSRMNNLAVSQLGDGYDYILFLNNDIEALAPGWLERMRGLASLYGVGAVGATLLYPDGRVQHSGVILGPGGYAEHAHKFAHFEVGGRRNPGYNCSLVVVRDWLAVTAACMMVPRLAFEAVGGFDEDLPVGFNDTDLCLKLHAAGLSVLNDGHSVLRHHESATRRPLGGVAHPEDAHRFSSRWRNILEAGDPYYNPILSLDRDHEPDHPDIVDAPMREQKVRLPRNVGPRG